MNSSDNGGGSCRTKLPEKYIDHDGCRIRYVDIGEGPPIVFLHGLGGKIEDNDICFECFADRFRVVAMDCPGTGLSDKPDREYDIDYLVDFTLDFTRRLGIEEMFLVGGSQGGMQVLLCCRAAPERIRRAAVYSPSGVWPHRPLLAALIKTLPPQAVWPLFELTSLFWFSPTNPNYFECRRQSLDFVRDLEMPGFGQHVMGCLASQFSRDFKKLYSEISTPVLILWGSNDFGMPVSMGRELVHILQNARLFEVLGAGHNVSCERPELFAEKVSEFFLEA